MLAVARPTVQASPRQNGKLILDGPLATVPAVPADEPDSASAPVMTGDMVPAGAAHP